MTAIIAKKINEPILEALLFLLGKLESRHKQGSLGHQPQGEHALKSECATININSTFQPARASPA